MCRNVVLYRHRHYYNYCKQREMKATWYKAEFVYLQVSFILFSDTVEHITQSTRGTRGSMRGGLPVMEEKRLMQMLSAQNEQSISVEFLFFFFLTCKNRSYVHFLFAILKKHISINLLLMLSAVASLPSAGGSLTSASNSFSVHDVLRWFLSLSLQYKYSARSSSDFSCQLTSRFALQNKTL